jgi:type II secretory pathway pseudopilin PulG
MKQGVSSAFTMIELIFAIVLIGFVMLAIPQMMQSNTRALEGTLAQEAIFLASTQLAQLTTFHWDGNSVDPAQLRSTAKILDTGGNNAYDRVLGTVLRPGGLDQDKHRRFFTNPLGPANAGGINAFAASMTGASGAAGYKENYNIAAAINYVTDSPVPPATFGFSDTPLAAGATSNIKMGVVTISDAGGTVIATLRAYAANIGEVDYAKRSF